MQKHLPHIPIYFHFSYSLYWTKPLKVSKLTSSVWDYYLWNLWNVRNYKAIFFILTINIWHCYTWRFSCAHRIQQFFIFNGLFLHIFALCFLAHLFYDFWLNHPFLVILQHWVGPMTNNHENSTQTFTDKRRSLLHFPFFPLGVSYHPPNLPFSKPPLGSIFLCSVSTP